MKQPGKTFMEMTKYQNMEPTEQQQGKAQPPIEVAFEGETIDLPEPLAANPKAISVTTAMDTRRSVRVYKQTPITLEALAYTLWSMQGVKREVKGITLRTVPSAGARHAFELYVLVNNVTGLKNGLYRYLALSHKLGLISEKDSLKSDLTEACLNQKMVSDSAVTFFLAADVKRMTYRYGERGYRFLHLDAGHVVQNLYLSVQAIDCGTVAIAAYDDDKVNKALNLDGENHFVLYIAPVGKIV